jgi:hypothetical protein
MRKAKEGVPFQEASAFVHRLRTRTKHFVNSMFCLNRQGLTKKEKKMNKNRWVFTLSFLASMIVAFLSPVFFPQLSPTAFARVVCDGGWRYDITFIDKHFYALDAANTVHNAGRRTVPLTASVKVTREIDATLDGEVSAETGLLLAKVQAKFHVNVARSFTSEQGLSITVPVPPRTETHVTYGTYIYTYRVHSYFVQAQGCLIRNSQTKTFLAPKADRAWNITSKPL